MVKADTKKYRTAKLWMQCVEVVERKDTLRRSVSRVNIPHTHKRFHKLPPALQGQGPVNPYTLMMRGQPVFTYMVSVPPCEQTFDQVSNFPRLWDTWTQGKLRKKRDKLDNSTNFTTHSPQTVLLKADTGG